MPPPIAELPGPLAVPLLPPKVVSRIVSTAPKLPKPPPWTLDVPVVVVALRAFPLNTLSLIVTLRSLPPLSPPPAAVAAPFGAIVVTVLPVTCVSLIDSIPPDPTPPESAHAQAVEPAGTLAVTWLLLTRLSESASWPSSQVPPQKATASPMLLLAVTVLPVIVMLRILPIPQVPGRAQLSSPRM